MFQVISDPTRKLAKGAALAALTLALTACDAFTMGNPFLPKAIVLVEASPQTTVMKVVYDFNTGVFEHEVETQSSMTILPRSGDIMPGVHFTDYTLRFRKDNGELIESYLLPHLTLGTAVYIPKTTGTAGGGASGGGKSIDIPIDSPQLRKYAEEHGFVAGFSGEKAGRVQNPLPWPQSLTGVVTFYGKDDNGYAIEAQGTFTVKFDTSIIPADAE